ncbi:hypothetical protein [Streptomyces sp. NPDC001787]
MAGEAFAELLSGGQVPHPRRLVQLAVTVMVRPSTTPVATADTSRS